MALSDILERIDADARAEADAIVASARSEAAALLERASAEAGARHTRSLEAARANAEREAATIAAGARLSARDAELTAHRGLIDETLAAVESAVMGLSDDRYAALLAREVAGAAVANAKVRIASADEQRLRPKLAAALADAGATDVSIDETPADVANGLEVIGDRVRVEVSPASMVSARRDGLFALADRVLFGEGGE